jgi:hypothetical protein
MIDRIPIEPDPEDLAVIDAEYGPLPRRFQGAGHGSVPPGASRQTDPHESAAIAQQAPLIR